MVTIRMAYALTFNDGLDEHGQVLVIYLKTTTAIGSTSLVATPAL